MDDPTQDGAGNVVDDNDAEGIWNGDDNRGPPDSAPELKLLSPETPPPLLATDDVRVLSLVYEVPLDPQGGRTMYPGNNWKVLATTDSDWDENVEVDPALENGRDECNSFRHKLRPQDKPPADWSSPLLSLWRMLWLELDSMAGGLDNPYAGCRIDATLWNTPHTGETQCEVNGFEPNDDGRYEGGTMTVTAGGTYEIIDHWDAFWDDYVVVSGNATADLNKAAGLVDDDVCPLPRKSDWSLLAAKLEPAYVSVDEIPNVSNINATFTSNLGIGASDLDAAASPVRNVPTWSTFWTIQVVSCHQGYAAADFDPDYLYHWHSPASSKQGDAAGLYGQTIPAGASQYDNVSAIHLETIRDVAAWYAWARSVGYPTPDFAAQDIERITFVHEVGWVFGCAESDGGVMGPGVEDPASIFTPPSILTIRSSTAIEEP